MQRVKMAAAVAIHMPCHRGPGGCKQRQNNVALQPGAVLAQASYCRRFHPVLPQAAQEAGVAGH